MNGNVKLVSKESHAKTKIKQEVSYSFAKKSNQAIISLGEFYQAAKSQPIVFIKAQDDNFFASVILGFESESNVFVSNEGKWEEREYIPAYFRRYPFIFVENGETLALGIDHDCELINEDEGEALFDKEGETTEYTKKMVEFLNGYHQSNMQTVKFVKELDELGLLEDATAKLQSKKGNIEFRGFKKVSEEKFNALDDEIILKLVKSGAYKFIVVHLASLLNFENLALLETKNSK